MMLLGIKKKMAQVFEGDRLIAVTLIHIPVNRVVRVKSRNGESYMQLSIQTKNNMQKKLTKPELGHYKKWGVEPGDILENVQESEVVVNENNCASLDPPDKYIDVFSVSKGKGFAGVIKRWNFSSQDATHGNSLSHRAPGSIGQRQFPGRVFKGKKMPGRMGSDQCATLKLRVVDKVDHTLVVLGSVPGANGSVVKIRLSNRT